MIPSSIRTALALAAVLLGMASAAHAQDAVDAVLDKVVTGVELQVEGRPETSAALLALVEIKPGDRLTLDAWRRASDRLTQVPRFQSVQVLVAQQPEGLRLIFNLEPRHPIEDVEFPGETGLPIDELKRQVRNRFGGLPSPSQLNQVDDFVTRLLHGEGFQSATVSHVVVNSHDPDRASLVVTIDPGARAVISKITVEGQSFLSRTQALARLNLTEGAPFRQTAIDTDAAKLRESLRGQGYYTAIVQVQPAFSADGSQVELLVRIETGPLVQLKVIGPLPGDKDDLIPIEREAAVDQDLLDSSVSLIERQFRRQGYWKADATYAQERTETDLIITFTVNRGKRYQIVGVDLPAGLQITQADLKDDPSLKQGVWFNYDAVGVSLTVMRQLYLLRGFHQIKFDPRFEDVAGRSENEGGVIIHPQITEGPRAVVSQVIFDLGEKPTVTEPVLRAAMVSDQQYYSQQLVMADELTIRNAYETLGFLTAQVAVKSELNATGTEAVIRVHAREGPRFTIGQISVVGNEDLSRDEVLRASGLKTGAPYNDTVRIDAQRRLYDVLALRGARVTAEPRVPGETDTRLTVSIEEGGAVTLAEGGGLEVGSRRRVVDGVASDVFEVAPRAFIEIGRRNLGGQNRSVSLFARVGLKRRGLTTTDSDANVGFIEHRVTGTYRARYAFGTEAELLFSVTSEQAARTGFNFFRRGANAELVYPFSSRVGVSGRYSFDVTRRFDELIPEDEQSTIDRLFGTIRLSVLTGSLFWDRRNNAIAPTRGGQITTSLDVAPRAIGSEVGFVRGFLEGTIFRQLPRRSFVLAGRVQLGLARGFERLVEVKDDEGQPVLGPDGQPRFELVADLPASQRFYAGGTSSVRGFQVDGLGVREIMDDNGVSDGGNAMIVMNGELRVASGKFLGKDLTTVGFVDAGNVFDRVGDLNLRRVRSAVGFGFRYDSTIGMLRFDLGFKTNRFDFPKSPERRWAWHLSLGEVF